jgi:FKBP-type peptidyl-prolyl cis-trans isomerase (trigger factor)
VSVDTQGFENNVPLESTQMKDYALILGSGILVP